MTVIDYRQAILLAVGTIFSFVFLLLVFFNRKRVYAKWAKTLSILACVAAIGWASLGLFFLRPHVRYFSTQLSYRVVSVQGVLGGMCLGFIFSIGIARPYRNKG